MTEQYFDYFVDCSLLIGANESSGLLAPPNIVYNDSSFHTGKYQQQILGALSSSVVLFPFSDIEHNYPPENFRKQDPKSSDNRNLKRQVSQNEFQTIHELVNQYNKKEVPDKVKSPGLNRSNSKLRSKRRSIKHTSLNDSKQSWGSVSMETLKSFPATYFHNNLQISRTNIKPQIQCYPLTDNLGSRSYAIQMEFYRKFAIKTINEVNDDKPFNIIIEEIKHDTEDDLEIIFVSNSVIFFTKFPYFDLFRDILSCFYNKINGFSSKTIEQELIEYSLILTRIPLIKSDRLIMKFEIHDDIFSMKRIIQNYGEFIDWDMTILFQTLSIDDIISVLMAMFQEQKIIFLSNDTNLITTITETIFLLFRPFQWRHCYLTSTPVHLYELIDAICPYIIGLPYEMKPKLMKHYQDIIIVDLQEGNIIIPQSCELKYVSKDLTDKLKQGFKNRDWIISNKLFSSLNPNTLEEFKENYFIFNKRFSQKVLTLFMIFMVDLFEEVIRNISIERKAEGVIVITFDKYLNTSQSQNVPFFNAIYHQDNFNCFIDERIRRKVKDGWFRICSHLYPDLFDETKPRSTLKSERYRSDSDFQRNNLELLNIMSNEDISQQEIVVPSANTIRIDFHQDFLDNINSLENTLDVMKLRAEVLLRSGNIIKSLEEFYKILRIIPLELIHSKLRALIRKIGKKEFRILKSMTFHSSLFEIISFDETRFSSSNIFEPIKTEQFNLPTNPISKNNFIEECRNSDIAEYEIAINTLFTCLTMECKTTKNRIKTVQPDIFKCFYNNWINSSVDLSDVELSSDFIDEVLIKGTESGVRVDGFGFGRVILTQYRLCFIPFAKTNSETITTFTDDGLRRLKMERKIRGFGKISEVLELTMADRESKVVIWVGHDCNIWYQLIQEISIVNRKAEEEKDKGLVAILTEHCLMYENMVNCSRKNSFFKNNIIEIGKKLLPHIHEKKTADKGTYDDQKKYIIMKLMPSPKNVITIDSVIEIYKPHLNNFDLLVACTSQDKFFINVLKILDKKQFMRPDITIEVPMRIQTMIRVPNTNKIVVCCMSHLLLIIDLNSHEIERKIQLDISTESYPICVANSEFNQRVLYFGTNKGEILCWDSQFDQVNHIVKLNNDDHASSIHIVDSNTIIVLSLYRFYVLDCEGDILNIVVISEMKSVMSKASCLALLTNNSTLLVGLARIPVLLEYDISDVKNIVCIRRKNIFNDKDFTRSDISEHYELSPTYVGITTIILAEDASNRNLWIMFKDGTIEIRDSVTWKKKAKFSAHLDVINKGMICTIKNQKVVISVGREDGKVNFWNLSPSP